jgi:hypothetical protein
MKAVMADILTLKDSINATSERDKNTHEMQQLKFQVAQYEGVLPVYQSRLKDTEELNKKLGDERAKLTKYIERIQIKLDRAESLVFSMGTPEAIRQRGPVIGTSTKHHSSSSQDDHSKVGAPKGTEQNPVEHVDLSVSPTDLADVTMATSAAPVIKLSFKEVIASVHKQNKANKNIEGSAGTSEQPPPSRLISLSTLSHKKEDTVGKRARSLGTAASEPDHKKPPQHDLVGDPNSALAQDASPAIRGRNQDREKEVEDEVKRSCQNIQ